MLTGPAASAYQQQLVKLHADLRRLSGIQSIEKRIALKLVLLPAYDAWIDGALAAASDNQQPAQDDVLVRVMIWRIDVGDFAGALPLVAHVLRWGLALPNKFERTAATLIVEETADAALKRLGRGEDVDSDLLQQVDDLTIDHDMPDQVRAKLNKAIGQILLRRAKDPDVGKNGPAGIAAALLEESQKRLARALDLDERVGVKKDLEDVLRAAKKATEGDQK